MTDIRQKAVQDSWNSPRRPKTELLCESFLCSLDFELFTIRTSHKFELRIGSKAKNRLAKIGF